MLVVYEKQSPHSWSTSLALQYGPCWAQIEGDLGISMGLVVTMGRLDHTLLKSASQALKLADNLSQKVPNHLGAGLKACLLGLSLRGLRFKDWGNQRRV